MDQSMTPNGPQRLDLHNVSHQMALDAGFAQCIAFWGTIPWGGRGAIRGALIIYIEFQNTFDMFHDMLSSCRTYIQ